VSQLKIWHFWVIGIERNVCRCTFNRYSVITEFAKLAAREQLCCHCTQKIIALQVSTEKSHILSCDTVLANEGCKSTLWSLRIMLGSYIFYVIPCVLFSWMQSTCLPFVDGLIKFFFWCLESCLSHYKDACIAILCFFKSTCLCLIVFVHLYMPGLWFVMYSVLGLKDTCVERNSFNRTWVL